MVVIRETSGLANGILEFCAGYALARELGIEEIAIDVGSAQQSAWGYCLDFLNIPTFNKISYFYDDFRYSYSDNISIPDGLRQEAYMVDRTLYAGLESAKEIGRGEKDIWIGDMLFGLQYHLKYWNELVPMLNKRNDSDSIEAFRKLIKGRTSVGVHFRRGDMLYADFATPSPDGYYKAAIEYVREKIDPNALFCVFSDDIKYAEELLGYNDNIRYIHFLGYDECDVDEFICLSLCNHRILPASSSYSDLADRLCSYKQKKAICLGMPQNNSKKDSYFSRIKKFIKTSFHDFLSLVFKNKFASYRWDRQVRDVYSHRIYLDTSVITRYEKKYLYPSRKDRKQDVVIDRILCQELVDDKAKELLEMTKEYELNYVTYDADKEKKIKYKKFLAYVLLKDYERAVNIGDSLWGSMIDVDEFRANYARCLEEVGEINEARIVRRRHHANIRIILFPGIPSHYSSTLYGVGELAVGLAKMGYAVSIVEEPEDDTEKAYITNHEYMTNRHEVSLGCKQYLHSCVQKKGFKRFIEDLCVEANRVPDDWTIVITRDVNVIKDKAAHTKYIYFDYLDEDDMERALLSKTFSGTDRENAVSDADFILTVNCESYAGEDPQRIICYKSDKREQRYQCITDRWKLHNCHRLSERTIRICESLADWIDEKHLRERGIYDNS